MTFSARVQEVTMSQVLYWCNVQILNYSSLHIPPRWWESPLVNTRRFGNASSGPGQEDPWRRKGTPTPACLPGNPRDKKACGLQ